MFCKYIVVGDVSIQQVCWLGALEGTAVKMTMTMKSLSPLPRLLENNYGNQESEVFAD